MLSMNKKKTCDQTSLQQMSRGQRFERFFALSRDFVWRVDVAPANGDCFYWCTCKALSEVGIECTIDSLRQLVSQKCGNEQLELYRVYAAAGIDGGVCVDNLDSLRTLIGQRHKFWADEFAVNVVVGAFDLCLLLVNEQQRSVSTTVVCCRSNEQCGNESNLNESESDDLNERKRELNERNCEQSAKRQRVANGSQDDRVIASERQRRYVILQLTRRSHYNLIRLNGKAVFEDDDLPTQVLRRFTLKR
jgi:hypothetical protein